MKKILCIEDEHFISELYARALRKNGYDVTTMLSGDDGLQVAQTDQYDIILLDIMIPGITGIEVLKKLRDLVATPTLRAKVVITTNLDEPEDIRKQIEELADGYLIKAEITPKQLVEFVDKIFV